MNLFLLLGCLCCLCSATPSNIIIDQNSDNLANNTAFYRLPLELKRIIFDFAPKEAFDCAQMGLLDEHEVEKLRVNQKGLAFTYEIPQLAELPNHQDLQALISKQPFPDTDEGKVEATKYFLTQLASRFRMSPVRKQLTLVFFDALANQDCYKNNIVEISRAFDASITASYKEPLIMDFLEYSRAVLFEAKKYDILQKILPAFKIYYIKLNNTEKYFDYWYELTCFKENIAEMFTNGKLECLLRLSSLLENKNIPPKVRYDFLDAFVSLEGGLEFVFQCKLIWPLRLLEAFVFLDFGDNNSEIFTRLHAMFTSNNTHWYLAYLLELLRLRYLKQPCPISYEPFGMVPFVFSVLIAENLMEPAFKFFKEYHEHPCFYNVLNASALHKYVIQNHSLWHKTHFSFTPKLVDYDFDTTLQYYGCTSKRCFVNRVVWKLHFDKDDFKFIYLHFSAREFEEIVSRSWSLKADVLNLNALIEIKGGEREVFLEYFRVFVRCWKKSSNNGPLNLTEKNLSKLAEIPGALEMMFENGHFFLNPGDFLSFLNHERAFELLKQRESNFDTFSGSFEKWMFNETVFQRAREFSALKEAVENLFASDA